VKVPRAHGRVSQPLPALLLALAACAAHSGPPAASGTVPAAAAKAVAEPELRVGEPIERAEIGPGETHAYRLPIVSAQYLKLVAKPRTVDLALTLLGPDGTVLAEADGPGGSTKRELLSLVSSVSGTGRLVVVRRDQGDRRGYRVELAEQRPARDDDALRVKAERLYAEAVHRRSLGSADEMRAALQVLEQALPLWRQIGDRNGESDTLTQIGLSHRSLGDLDAALTELTRSAAIAESQSYLDGLAEALNGQALIDKRQGRVDAALEKYHRALVIAEERGSAEQRAKVLQNLGMLHFDRGETRQALERFELALPLWQATGELGEEANTTQSVGLIYLWYRGELGKATQYFERASELSQEAGDRRTQGSALLNLAGTYRRRRQLQRALVSYREAADRLRALGDPYLRAVSLEALGSLYFDLGDLDRAAHHYREAEMVYREQADMAAEASVLTSIGLLEQQRGDLQSARSYFERALASSEILRNRRTEGLSRHRLGSLLRVAGDLKAAKESLHRALELRQEVGDRSEEAQVLLDLGACESEQGDAVAAAGHFARARELARAVESPALEAASLLRWAAHDRNAGDLMAALDKLEAAGRIIESTASSVLSRDLRATYFGSQRTHAELYIDVLMRLAALESDGAFERMALEASEWARARSLLDLLAEGRIELRTGVSPELKEKEAKLDEGALWTRGRLAALLASSQADALQVTRLRQELADLGERRQEIEEEIRQRHPRYSTLRYPRPLRLPQVQELLDDRSALLEYFLGTDRSFLFVVKRSSLNCYRLPPAREIAGLVERLREALGTPQRKRLGGYISASHRLYELLIAPAEGALEGMAGLIIIPDRALHLLPFEVLLTQSARPDGSARGLPFLILRHSITYAPSASVLSSLRSSSEPRQPAADGALRFLAFADPDSSPLQAPALDPLPGARREVLEIANLYPSREVAVFLGADANEENVKSNGRLEDALRIHFATHGIVDPTLPELTALVLAARTDSAEDGLLHLDEIFDLKTTADVVVLSGCDTGLGRQVTGEGLIGLTQAFFYAGTRSVIVSLWPVSDAASPLLMPDFYRRLEEGASKAEALRQTKLHLLDSDQWSHPFYWAQFILMGDGSAQWLHAS